jgi:BNR repeat-like domain
MKLHRVAALAAAVLLAGAAPAAANVALTRISSDPFANTTSQHATEVEPDTFAHHGTVVTTFQVGRFFDGGATDIGVVRSGTSGAGWDAPGFLPGMTFSAGASSPFERVSDASVAYDARHATWLISSIPLSPNTTSVPTVFVSRSTDDGRTWGPPVSIPPPAGSKVDLDKNWTVCDNASTRFMGHCYTQFDNFGAGNIMLMSTSTDGGATWSTPIPTAGNDKGIGGQPLVRPDGTVVVPFESLDGKIKAYRSTNGGASWTTAVQVAGIRSHAVAGGLRTSALPSAEIDAAGRTYVAWQDCRFRTNCTANDIVYSKSLDGVTWSAVTRVPIDPVTSTADHFIPGLAVDRSTRGATAHLALTYYFYPQRACGSSCSMDVGYISSPDGGAHWGAAKQLAGPMTLTQIASTSQGPMVGDYISTSFVKGRAVPVFAVGKARPTPSTFDEASYAPTTPLSVATATQAAQVGETGGQVTGQGPGETHHAIRDD